MRIGKGRSSAPVVRLIFTVIGRGRLNPPRKSDPRFPQIRIGPGKTDSSQFTVQGDSSQFTGHSSHSAGI